MRFDSIDDVYSDDSPWFMSDEPNAFDQLAEARPARGADRRDRATCPSARRRSIQLYYVEELNLEEIGQVLGVGAARDLPDQGLGARPIEARASAPAGLIAQQNGGLPRETAVLTREGALSF